MRKVLSKIAVWGMLIGIIVVIGYGTHLSYGYAREKAVYAATAMGFKDVKVLATHYVTASMHGCSDSDNVGFKLEGTNPAGQRIKMQACSGLVFKGVTIRF